MFGRVLTVCVGNVCRSPMAQVILAHRLAMLGKEAVVESAGLSALIGHPADAIAQELMRERGLDLSAHRARQLTPDLIRSFELVLVMEAEQQKAVEAILPSARGRVHRIGRWGGFDVPGPFRRGRPAFERAVERIDRGVADLEKAFWAPVGDSRVTAKSLDHRWTVSGLAGSGLVLHNGSESLPITADGPFAFLTAVRSGATYSVTVSTQPSGPSQVCTVTGGTGAVGSANVTSVSVSCSTSSFTVGGTVSGIAGSGLALSDGIGAPLAIAGNGTYAFPAVPSGTAYAVTVTSQPTTPWQTCSVSNPTGTLGGANVTNADVTCVTRSFNLAATVSLGPGTPSVELHSGGDVVAASTNGTVSFPTQVLSGATYQVTAVPPTCAVTGGGHGDGTGTMGGADITVDVSCP